MRLTKTMTTTQKTEIIQALRLDRDHKSHRVLLWHTHCNIIIAEVNKANDWRN